MVVRKTCAQRLAHPIGIESCHYILVSVIIGSTVEVIKYLAVLVETAVIAREFLKLQLLAGVHKIVVAQVGPAHVVAAVVSETQLACLRLLCLDYYNAVGCLRTIDGCRRSILKNGDALDTVHTHVGDALERGLETVKNEEWLVGVVAVLVRESVDTCRTVDVDVQLGIRVGTCEIVLHDDERRVECRKALQHILVADGLKFLLAIGCSRTSEALLLARIDTRNNGLADSVGIGLKTYDILLAGRHAHLLLLHSHIRERKCGFASRQHYAEFTGLVGQCQGLAMLVLNANAKERLVLIVYYNASIHLPLSCGGRLRRTINILGLRIYPPHLE